MAEPSETTDARVAAIQATIPPGLNLTILAVTENDFDPAKRLTYTGRLATAGGESLRRLARFQFSRAAGDVAGIRAYARPVTPEGWRGVAANNPQPLAPFVPPPGVTPVETVCFGDSYSFDDLP